ncbi:hypothetical protein GY45DRAFT_494026 [Cubamyces sp. BRFM 1775]|nr:hypothetical protein GY45DRAFT_494026 [Cubamyces sp. BRFM 1775]
MLFYLVMAHSSTLLMLRSPGLLQPEREPTRLRPLPFDACLPATLIPVSIVVLCDRVVTYPGSQSFRGAIYLAILRMDRRVCGSSDASAVVRGRRASVL